MVSLGQFYDGGIAMSYMNRTSVRLGRRLIAGLIGVSAVAFFGCGARAALIGVQWNDSGNGFANNPLGSSLSGGAPGYVQTNWNEPSTTDHNSGNTANWSQSGIPLVDSTGAATGVTLAFTSLGSLASQTYYTYPQPTLTSNEKLTSDSIIEFGAPGGDIIFSNVASGTYSVVVYTLTEYPSAAAFSVNGASPTFIKEENGQAFSTGGDVWASYPNDAVDASNYLVLGGVTPISGTIDLNYYELGGTDAVLNAVQLVPAAVPEPASVSLLGAVGFALIHRRGKRAC
jgi:hypothetical protein